MNDSLFAAGQPVTYQRYTNNEFVPARGLGHVFEGKLYFTKDIVDDSFVPKGTKLKAVPEPAAKPAPKAAPKPAPKGKHVKCCHVSRGRVGLRLQHVFHSTCCAQTRACVNTGTPCCHRFAPVSRTWPVLGQGGKDQNKAVTPWGRVCAPLSEGLWPPTLEEGVGKL